MNRRGFLSLFGGLTAAAIVDPDILIWTPEAKTVFVPMTIRLVSLNVLRTRQCGLLHNGLAGPDDVISTISYGMLDPVCKAAVDQWVKLAESLNRTGFRKGLNKYGVDTLSRL